MRFMVLTPRGGPCTLSGMQDVGHTLREMDFPQLLLVFLFVASYTTSIGGLATPRGRRWGAAVAAVSAIGFVATTEPWVNAALLLVFSLVGIGGFIACVWGVSAAVGASGKRAEREAVAAGAAPGASLPPVNAETSRRSRRRLLAP